MSYFDYTHAWAESDDFGSSSVDLLHYDEPTRTLYVEWLDSSDTYAYKGVSLEEVEDAVDSFSVGASVAALKQKYGPGTNLGYASGVERDEEPVLVSAGNLSDTTEYSLQTPVAPVVEKAEPATTEYSLQTPDTGLSLEDGAPVFELVFNHDGEEKSHVIRRAEGWQDAVDALDEFARSVGLNIEVTKVVITFE